MYWFIRIVSSLGGLGIIIYYVLLYFTDNKVDAAPYAPLGVALAALVIFNTTVAGTIKKRNENLFIKFEVLIYSILGFLLINLNGGYESPLFFLTYFGIVFAFFYSIQLGIVIAAMIALYIIYQQFLDTNGNFAQASIVLIVYQLGGIMLASAIAAYYSKLLKSTATEKSQMQGMVKKLTADKSKDDAILSSMADGVYVVDSERKIVIFNEAAEELTGWKSADACGLFCGNVMKLKDDQDLSVCEKSCPMLVTWSSGENVVRNDMCFVNKFKKAIQISGSYMPIKDNSGEVNGGLCVFRDITEQHALERQKEEFVSTASHEMRTPLTALEGYIDLAKGPTAQIDPKTREFLEKAYAQVRQMSHLMQDLLNVSRIEDNKLELRKASFEIADLIKSVIEIMKPKADEKKLKLTFNESNINFGGKKAIGVSTKVAADIDKIREVLNNLIENATKYTREGSIQVSVTYDHDFATVCVADTGIGISEDDQKHLFQKFYQVADYETREVGGTGLGLYITRSLIELNGGKIWIESKKGAGSKFLFTLPRSID
ncbi:MAG: two-component sensor kinase, probably involved in phosphate sensing [candidate division CPR2 bacterium GW2011_GWC2_39_10]|uniref:histidine kinase n=1 Tax=candidate division CPR2 bacterium GW2011_GWC2_39_10 TaxID=1618345 RepID=A0A0G0M377_UNCC2|nr:MAG: two-component sensor kinase, probably involved in phosphate sensing [candidate division CPR2 bacterium GW2011_GWC2_39_10]